ncbi:MAG: hypothetical protein V4482_00755 [Pseudomonadota bacterium]
MNFFKDRELALRLKNNQVSSKERFGYLLITMILTNLFLYDKHMNKWDTYISISVILLTVAGVIACYNTNKSGDDENFIERFTCISIPVMVRMSLICIPLALIKMLFSHNAFEKSDIFKLMYYIISLSYFYFRLNSAIKIASH